MTAMQAKVTTLENKVTVLSQTGKTACTEVFLNIYTTKPICLSPLAHFFSTVAFTAMFQTEPSDYNAGIPLSSHQTLILDRVMANAGNAYNPHNGIITAPVSGYV
jgi:hypothetical protein